MKLRSLTILNYKNIREANLSFADKINCFVGLNGQGKTNLLDAIYYLSFTKSFFNVQDSQNITHDADFALIQGEYDLNSLHSLHGSADRPSLRGKNSLNSLHSLNRESPQDLELISCGIKRGQKKQFRRGKKDYKRLIDHIGLIPLVIVSPQDSELITDGSDERRRFLDGVISQLDRTYLDHLTKYNALLKQRNALLKQCADTDTPPFGRNDVITLSRNDANSFTPNQDLFEILELQMADHAAYIFRERTAFIERFVPLFRELYAEIAGTEEVVSLSYVSQLQDRDLVEAFRRTRSRDIILGWTSQGIHKDDLPMQLGDYPLRQVGSQGQQKTFLLSLKLAQALYISNSLNSLHGSADRPSLSRENSLNSSRPILLLDDIFDKLDSTRVEHIVSLLQSERFGQIFITDTDRQHLTDILSLSSAQNHPSADNAERPSINHIRIFHVENGTITPA